MTMEEAIKILKYQHDNGFMEESVRQALAMAIEALQREDKLLKSLEANDPLFFTDVVRCKDCAYFHNGDCYNGNFPIKGDLANVYFDMKETDFCSYGERKGGDDE